MGPFIVRFKFVLSLEYFLKPEVIAAVWIKTSRVDIRGEGTPTLLRRLGLQEASSICLKRSGERPDQRKSKKSASGTNSKPASILLSHFNVLWQCFLAC